MLKILTVANPSACGGSSIEVEPFHYLRDAKPDLGKEYDLGSIGEVLAVHGPYEDPPKWMVTYEGRVSAKEGDWIEPKD
jgi:hypothetical protein